MLSRFEKIVPLRGFGGYQGLKRAYLGTGLREDMEQLEGSAIVQLLDRLRATGVSEKMLASATVKLKRAS